MYKRGFVTVFAVLITAICCCYAAYAEELPLPVLPEGGVSPCIATGIPESGGFHATVSSTYNSTQTVENSSEEFYTRMCEGIKNHAAEIDISDFNISVDDFKSVFFAEYRRAALTFPQYLAITACGYYPSEGTVETIYPHYLTTTDEHDEYTSRMQKRIEHFLGFAEKVPDSDIAGKLLVIHDAFVYENKYAYDELKEFESIKSTGKIPDDEKFVIFTPYGALVNKNAVCQGNTLALNMIYDELNSRLKEKLGTNEDLIKTGMCISDEINHIWNCVKIGGEWYHIDETWNDPVFLDENGNVKESYQGTHNYFLCSTELFNNRGIISDTGRGDVSKWLYYGPEPIVCTDTSYESGQIFNGDFKYTKNGQEYNAGAYYGNICYENGRYKITLTSLYMLNDEGNLARGYYSNLSNIYQSYGLKSYGLLAGEKYNNSSRGGDVIEYFATEATAAPADMFLVSYDGNRMTGCVPAAFIQEPIISGTIYVNRTETPGKMIIWDSDTSRPLSEVRTIE